MNLEINGYTVQKQNENTMSAFSPEITVIIPIYNVEKYLKEALDSVLAQTMSDLEIILIDDGSPDKCPQIIDEYAAKDNRIITVHKENGGYGQSMNIGLDMAKGKYIAVLEPDDYIAPDMYKDLLKIAQQYNSDIVKSCFYDNLQSKEETRILKINWDDDKIPQGRSFNIKECGLFLRYHPSIWSCIYKREFLAENNIRFEEVKGSSWTDNPFQVQTMCLARKINYTPEAYYYWRRLNKSESESLKDFTVPFKRSDEIHNWLDKNNIRDSEILSNLYYREIAYVNLVLGKKEQVDESECARLINKILGRMDKKLILDNKTIDKRIKNKFKKLLKNPLEYRKKLLRKEQRKKFISIRWNKNEKRIVLCGKTLFKP